PTAADRRRALRGVLAAIGDTHGHVLAPEDVRRFRRDTARGRARGLGLLAIHPERIVVHVFPGGPAERAGVRAGDVVEAVNGAAPRQSGSGQLLDLAQHETATLALSRRGSADEISVTLEPREYEVARLPCGRPLGDDL